LSFQGRSASPKPEKFKQLLLPLLLLRRLGLLLLASALEKGRTVRAVTAMAQMHPGCAHRVIWSLQCPGDRRTTAAAAAAAMRTCVDCQ
jgi:hypothetical protein